MNPREYKLSVILFVLLALIIGCDNSPTDSDITDDAGGFISLERTAWKLSSKPTDMVYANARGNLIWYNPYEKIRSDHIWDENFGSNETTNTLWLEFSPSDTGFSSGSWAGVTQRLKEVLVPDGSYRYLELRIHCNKGYLFINLGQISEDINGNGLLDSEDDATDIANIILDPGEDTGLDGLADADEPGYDLATNPDPNGDNWWYNGFGIRCADCTDDPDDYRFINGTEGNSNDPAADGLPDSEDLDQDGALDNVNNYRTYYINLIDDYYFIDNPRYFGWRTVQIPIHEDLKLESIRFWLISEPSEPFTVGLASIKLFGYKASDGLGYGNYNYIRDYAYAYGRIFDLGRMPINHDDPSEYDFHPGDSILNITIFKSNRTGTGYYNPDAPEARFYVDPTDTTKDSVEITGTTVEIVDPSEYVVHPTEFWVLFEKSGGGTNKELGYYMVVKRVRGETDTIGYIDEEPYRLKLLRHGSPSPTYVTWYYEWRNVYYLRGTNIDLNSLEIDIFKGSHGTEGSVENANNQNGTPYIQILGLDRYDEQGSMIPDGLVDYTSYIIDPIRGLLIFPDRRPFASSRSFVESVVLDPQVPQIYDKTYADQDVIKGSQYYIEIIYWEYDYTK